ncbi:CBM35 domain-containing protein [Lacisediminihabitans sp. H27-G8]|uniref:CBM35 domain-containing protein n=1 Tax=Lacisediminihabitans sp. H27-G8 TaxID=3111909 RepID=UPI0038FC0199
MVKYRPAWAIAAVVAIGVAGIVTVSEVAPPAHAATLTISKASYLDKTLAGILGQVGGVTSGYEYASENPYPTDACFSPASGPYSGDAPASCWTPNGYPGYDRVGLPNFASNEVGSDDDYHIDFFDQLILGDHGPNVSYQDIKDEWVAHNIGDWGPGGVANDLMRNAGYLPPFTGQAEYDQYYWLTEGYIENDTVGMVAPGMPSTARDLTGKFASVTTEFDSITWAKLYGTMYSLGYFATDARTVLADASVVLPRNSWPYQIYQKAVALHNQNTTDWRWAQGQLLSFVRNVYGQDNVQAIPDRNNGSMILSILYGNNDYLTTLKIASLIGNDADCTASGVAGLMGIIKGMAGTPQPFKDKIYQNGAGRYINDLTTGFPPNIKSGYPTSQSWDSIAALYRSNAAAQIVANGGSQDSTNFYVNAQTVLPEKTVLVDNYDFEQGTLAGWTAWTSAPDTGSPNVFAESNGTALSGAWKGTVVTDSAIDQARLSTQLRGLQAGATYRVSAFIQSDQVAALYASNFGGSELDASVVGSYANSGKQWVNRSIEFTPTGSTAEVGLYMPSGPDGFGAIDDLSVQQISTPSATVYQAEAASISGGDIRTATSASGGSYVGGLDDTGNYVLFTVTAPAAGEYRAAINFANATTGTSTLAMAVNGASKATVPFPRTPAWGTFSRNIVNVPVVLAAGTNTIRLTRPANGGFVELDALTLSTAPTPVYGAITDIAVGNAGFETAGVAQTPANWTTWPGTAGTDADADFVETGGFEGTNRLTQYKAATYEVYSGQTLTGLTNGTYTLTAWATGGGGQTQAFLSAKGYGSSVPELTARTPGLGFPQWRRISISGIVVTNGTLQLGAYSKASSGQWSSYDGFQLWRQ